jgi:hypothetical protein
MQSFTGSASAHLVKKTQVLAQLGHNQELIQKVGAFQLGFRRLDMDFTFLPHNIMRIWNGWQELSIHNGSHRQAYWKPQRLARVHTDTGKNTRNI